VHILLDCLEARNCRMKYLNDKWLSMNKEVAYRKIIRCTNKDQIRNLGRYLDTIKYKCGSGSAVGIATGYGLDGPGIESRCGRDFPHLSRPALRPTQPLVQWVPGFSRGKERPGRDADPSPPSSAVVKKE